MLKTIEKLKGWLKTREYIGESQLKEVLDALEQANTQIVKSTFTEACERANLTRENKELKSRVGILTARNEGLRLQKQILDNISHVGYHPDYVQELKEQIEDLNVKLAKMATTAGMYKEHYEFQLAQVLKKNAQIVKLNHDQEAETKELKNQLTWALMHKTPGAEKEIEALQQINAAILDVVAAQKDYTHKLEAALGAYGATHAEVGKVQGTEAENDLTEIDSQTLNKLKNNTYRVREVPAAYEPRWLDVK